MFFAAALVFFVAACSPMTQKAAIPMPDFTGPQFGPEGFVSHDGAVLGLTVWQANQEAPKAVIIALHGMNDYARMFEQAAPFWAQAGITTYAYDARGFGRSPQRGIWGGHALMVDDLRAAIGVARARHQGVPLVLVGESMGAATILAGLAHEDVLQADRLVLIAPAVRGWSNMPLAYRVSLRALAYSPLGKSAFETPRAVVQAVQASDNRAMLEAVGRDPNMIFQTRPDTLLGLVDLMERAFQSAHLVPPQSLVLYGSNDKIVPRHAVEAMVARLPASVTTVEYPLGYHMLTRDLQAQRVWRDVLAFIEAPDAPLPSFEASPPSTPIAPRHKKRRGPNPPATTQKQSIKADLL
ncbi:MAG: hypothetical protein RLZZ157_674 [Pseudomonadota bacterium]|jgi:alpha-beta hydrolase superfamily lysophospholipase